MVLPPASFRKKLLPITPEGVISDTKAALTGKLSHDDLTKYNQVQKLLYAGVIVVGILIVLSGLAIWKPVQLQYLTALFGGYEAARYVHFFCMAGYRRLHGGSCRARPSGAEEPARHDHWSLVKTEHGHGPHSQLLIPGVDKTLLVRDAIRTMPDLTRRRFISGGASLGALTLLTGCDVSDSFSAEEMLKQVSKFNDGVQALMFNPNAMAPTFPESAITKPFPFNAYYSLDEAPEVDGKDWKLEVSGLVENKKPWTLEELCKPAAGHADHPAYLRRGLERDRKTGPGTPLRDFLKIRRRRHPRQICLVRAPTKMVTIRRSTCKAHCMRRPR